MSFPPLFFLFFLYIIAQKKWLVNVTTLFLSYFSLKYQARKLADLSARGIAILLSTSIPLLVLTNSSLLFDIEPINIFRYRVCNPRYMSIWDFVVNYPDP